MINLTDEQKAIVRDGINFIKHSSDQVFEYEGPAGTGKSVVLAAIAEGCGIPLYRIAPMAYTGQAAIVMRLKGMPNAKSIHSWLFSPVVEEVLDRDGRPKMDEYLNRPKFDVAFVSKPLADADLIFIDEASMVPEYLRGEIESRGKKIIATGDLNQLPPIYGKSAYLNPNNPNIRHLTTIMRQSESSPIVYLADRARKGLPIHEGYYGNVLVIDESYLNEDMIMGASIIICGKNKTRDSINDAVRYRFLDLMTELPTNGERVVCRKNNWNIEVDGINLANGLIGEVMNFPDINGFDGKNYTMSFRPLFMSKYFRDLKCDYKYLTSPREAKNNMKFTKYDFGEKFEFAYAITTHMSQGGQYPHGIYIEEFLGKDTQRNLNYTGITRFSESLIYVKPARKKMYMGSKL